MSDNFPTHKELSENISCPQLMNLGAVVEGFEMFDFWVVCDKGTGRLCFQFFNQRLCLKEVGIPDRLDTGKIHFTRAKVAVDTEDDLFRSVFFVNPFSRLDMECVIR